MRANLFIIEARASYVLRAGGGEQMDSVSGFLDEQKGSISGFLVSAIVIIVLIIILIYVVKVLLHLI